MDTNDHRLEFDCHHLLHILSETKLYEAIEKQIGIFRKMFDDQPPTTLYIHPEEIKALGGLAFAFTNELKLEVRPNDSVPSTKFVLAFEKNDQRLTEG